MISPNARIQLHALSLRRPRLSYRGTRHNPVSSVQPTVRSPFQAVHDVMPHGIVVPPIQQNFRRAVRNIVTIAIRQEHEIGRAGDINTAEPTRQTREPLTLVPEDFALIEMSGAA